MFEKLTVNKEFRRAYGRGKSFVGPQMVSYVLRCKGDKVRIGITASKKLGTAVARNRAKRVITAAFRECASNIKPGCDIVFVARSRILSAKSTEVFRLMRSHLIAADVWQENDQ